MVKPTLKLSCLRWYRKYKTSIWGMILTIYSWQRWEWFIVRFGMHIRIQVVKLVDDRGSPGEENNILIVLVASPAKNRFRPFSAEICAPNRKVQSHGQVCTSARENRNVTLDRIRMKTPVLNLLNFVNVPTGVSTTYPVDIPDLLDACFLAYPHSCGWSSSQISGSLSE